MQLGITALLSAAALLVPARAGGAEAVRLPTGDTVAEVDFERHVEALLGRHGCNAGSCHGSFQGKGGFRLSLFNHDPRRDYLALTRDGMGRRVNPNDPDHSLFLLKPTAQIPHEGGRRFAPGSWQHRLLRAWIAQGRKWKPGSGALRGLRVEPVEHLFRKPGETARLRVLAEFADGSSADVAPFCDFRSRDEAVVEVSPEGIVRGLRPGDAAIIVSYLGQLRTTRIYVPTLVPEGFVYPDVPAVNVVDREVLAKLRKLNVVPSDLADDATFLRRVTLDVIGSLPSPDEVRSFLADKDPLKRQRKIDELLAHPLHAALWATRFCDITGADVNALEGSAALRARRAKMWHDWFRKRLAGNEPYDRIVHGVLCATSRAGKDVRGWIEREAKLNEAAAKGFTTTYADRPALDLFWRRTGPEGSFSLEQVAERTAAAFLGVRLECAQCHKHPFDRWTQADYRAFANVFARTRFDSSPEVRAAVQTLLEERRQGSAKPSRPLPRLREVYVSARPTGLLTDPGSGLPLPPRALGGPEIATAGDPREPLFRWLVRADNPFFARAFVNRVWAHYFGAGLVEPVDNFSLANPPSNQRLLDALAQEFTASGYDIRRLERTILASRTYQLSSIPNSSNGRDRGNHARCTPRRLLAEVVVDALGDALGVHENFGADAPPGARAIEVAPNRLRNQRLATVFRLFGRPERTAACDCERSPEPALPQTLFLMTDTVLLKRIGAGRLKKLLATKKTDGEVVEELFLATLSRFPDETEKKGALEHLKTKKRKDGFVDIIWALINTREFILNH
jgi:hypothetical protein